MKYQFLNDLDMQNVRLSSEVMFLSQVVDAQQVEIAKLQDDLRIKGEQIEALKKEKRKS